MPCSDYNIIICVCSGTEVLPARPRAGRTTRRNLLKTVALTDNLDQLPARARAHARDNVTDTNDFRPLVRVVVCVTRLGD